MKVFVGCMLSSVFGALLGGSSSVIVLLFLPFHKNISIFKKTGRTNDVVFHNSPHCGAFTWRYKEDGVRTCSFVTNSVEFYESLLPCIRSL